MTDQNNIQNALIEAIKQALDGEGFHYDFNGDHMFKLGVNLAGKMPSITIYISARPNAIVCRSFAPVNADPKDPETMAKVAEYLDRASYGMNVGAFEMDWNDGELSFRNGFFHSGSIPTYDQIVNLFSVTAVEWNTYGDGLLAVLFGGADPKQTIEKIEAED